MPPLGVQLKVDVRSKPLQDLLTGLPGYLAKGVAAAAVRAGESFVRFHKRERLSAASVGASGPLAATGTNRRAGEPAGAGFVGKRTVTISGSDLNNLSLEIALRSPVARAHEEGRTFTASGSKLIPVPLPAAQDGRGKTSKAARALLRAYGDSSRAAESGFTLVDTRGRTAFGLVPIHSKKTGKTYLAKINPGKKGRERLTFLFRLERSITNDARLEFLETWNRFEPKAIEIFRQAVPYAIAAAKRKYGAGDGATPTLPAAFQIQGPT